ncbi:undecaprenyl-diphosphate phosphatase [Paenibacillus sabuli]
MTDLWTLFKYAVLGLLQGFTEPIPVSSSGHLVIVQRLFGLEIEGFSFEVLVNFASLLAVLLIYRADIWKLCVGGWNYVVHRDPSAKAEFRFIVLLVVATIPAGVLGVLLDDWLSEVFKGLITVGATLLVTGTALWLIRNLRGRKNDAELKLKDAIVIGFAQALALMPGLSRSGMTIVAAMGLGLKQETALRFSFLLFIPISLGGMVLSGMDLVRDPLLSTYALPYALAFLCSLVASYYSLRWFMGIMARGNLKYFSWYCFVAGALVILYALI